MSKVDNWQVGLVATHNREFEKACELWLPLAENGNPMAQANVAYLHMRGLIKDADHLIGEYWLSKAKECDQPEILAMVEIIEKQREIDVFNELSKGFG